MLENKKMVEYLKNYKNLNNQENARICYKIMKKNARICQKINKMLRNLKNLENLENARNIENSKKLLNISIENSENQEILLNHTLPNIYICTELLQRYQLPDSDRQSMCFNWQLFES